jgi:hypothetical protein
MHAKARSHLALLFPVLLASAAAAALAMLAASPSGAAEPAACLSPDPAQWPSSSKPYFMVVVDTSGSMTTAVTGTNSCGYGTNRIGHARCAVKNTVLAYGGQVNFGLAGYARRNNCAQNPTVACPANSNCTTQWPTGTDNQCGPWISEPTIAGGTNVHAGAHVIIPMLQDHYWSSPPDPTNVSALLQLVDNTCGVNNGPANGGGGYNSELGAAGNTPLGGVLFDMNRYFAGTYVDKWSAATLVSPIGTLAQGERPCRSLNIILITDGDETCDDAINPAPIAGGCRNGQAAYLNNLGERLASYEADRLFIQGVTVGGQNFKVKTHVIAFAGADLTACGHISTCGGTGAAYSTANEAQLATALANIVGGAVQPEVCDNADNNCNGCTDEGYTHYCNVQPVTTNCCTLARATCLANYKASITAGNPSGDLTLLPCTTPTQQTDPLNWLCFDPKERCDNTDNNCQSGIDEGVVKCGTPAHCPTAETCNGLDDNCDGIVDNPVGGCPSCTSTPEVCDGCDNDCDGVADNGIAAVPCGLASPPNCVGTVSCKAAQPVGTPGGCVAGGGYNACSWAPQSEICDTLDNDCNGIADDGIAAVPCVPVGTPAGLVYGGTSQCVRGTQACGGTCNGFVGPSAEICDGIDNNCDGTVDNGAAGVGQACGISTPPCSQGVVACIAGVLVCQGGKQPQAEICDGIDNNCDGTVDNAPMADGPAAGASGCWTLAGNCCSFGSLTWCAPAGATCNAAGTLTAPCAAGALTCHGAAGWSCDGSRPPSTETCDGIDNNCNGTVDDGIAQVGQPCGSNVGVCKMGAYQCTAGQLLCSGGVNASIELCNGLDDNCDGTVDNNVQGMGLPCGNSTLPCKQGVTACVGGAVVCQGAVLPQSEVCNGIDDNCDGQVDNAPLSDAPASGQSGCWTLPGSCCTFSTLSWCPPSGATCNAAGTLTTPCAAGTLVCGGISGWSCQGSANPSTETCDSIDNNCDGVVDNVTQTPCVPTGTPPTLVYGGTSQCKRGLGSCGNCAGFVGPSAEICDGIDNDCDGTVDNGVPGVGQTCGINKPPCTPGAIACVGGALVCQGGTQPQPEKCDGIDNNCNGAVDEAPLSDGPSAGASGCWTEPGSCCSFGSLTWCPPTGAGCNDAGTLTTPCTQGTLTCHGASGWSCDGAKKPTSEVCDGIDNNCNGTTDDGIAQVGQPCGSNVGVCKTGLYACTGGQIICSNGVVPGIEVCNGLDDNCDGTVDNNVQGLGMPCGNNNPPCTTGTTACVGGNIVCQGGTQPKAELCNGIDDNCDGQIDNAPLSDAPSAGQGGCWTQAGSCCTFAGLSWCPPAGATCYTAGTLTAPCSVGALACTGATGWACVGAAGPSTEVCDTKDNNCDGAVDNIATTPCAPTGTPPGLVYGGMSQCKLGALSCNGCVGFIGPSAEICDGLDNDCDGAVDDNVPGVGQGCGISSPPCTPGTIACVAGVLLCQGGTQPQPETCDGIDNNCNGTVDEAPLADGPGVGESGCWKEAGNCCTFGSLTWCPPAGGTCNGLGTLTTPCAKGTLMCHGSTGWSCDGPKTPSTEVCDGVDNNCNGTADDGIAQVGQPCGVNQGICKAGTIQCTAGQIVCAGSIGPSIEVCNGLDDDCDGTVDNNVQGLGMPCGNLNPPCTPGLTACVGGSIVCTGGTQPKAEECNGVDDNCDGQIDNAPLSDAPLPGQGGCWLEQGNCCTFEGLSWCPPAGGTCYGTGSLSAPCSAGTLTCSGAPGWICVGPVPPSGEVCDNVDNNCDGAVDNVSTIECVPAGTASGLIYGGTSQCKKGTIGCGSCAGFVGPSAEICDGIDNDCDGTVDEGATGVGSPCGVNIPPCSLGLTACVSGALICQGGVQPQPEICDGIDNNCNGSIDEAPLSDAPPAGQSGCWSLPGNCCTFANLTWCPPPGATCNDNGTLPPPCNKGFLACDGAYGWTCKSGKVPEPEVCDGIDNDCNGSTDEGQLPGSGDACGSNVGECKLGTIACLGGILSCQNAVNPVAETCNGLDDNCNGLIDDGVSTGGACAMPYDASQYPGERDHGACQPGITQCDGFGGMECLGGIAPSPEICDGIDNDCDGDVDEAGPPVDGINGTANPQSPDDKIGGACGLAQGECKAGTWGCANGIFVCLGATGKIDEQCDCKDNDCNGVVDNANPGGEPPLCGTGKDCIRSGNACMCAGPCGTGEFQCPAGQKCLSVLSSETGEAVGNRCVPDVDPCGDCAKATVKDANNKTICAPAGTDPAGCQSTPVCACKDVYGCREPCFNKSCSSGEVCASFGTKAGQCVLDNCFNTGCQGCNQACNLGDCVENPCKPGSCPAGQECKPKPDFSGSDCVSSCATVKCGSTQTCKNGICVDTCDPPCATGMVCNLTTLKCVTDQCASDGGTPCPNGAWCDPLTGKCGNGPCEGVLCPTGQHCDNGDCVGGGAGGSGGSGGAAGSAGKAGSGGGNDAGKDSSVGDSGVGGAAGGSSKDGGTAGKDNTRGVFGMATGGGGCECRVGWSPFSQKGGAGAAAVLLLALLIGRRRSGARRADERRA